MDLVFPLFVSVALAGKGPSLPQRLADRATAPDVVLIPPVGEPSPKAGSFLIPYAPPEGQEPDKSKFGTSEVGPSSCTAELTFKSVEAAEKRKELWKVKSGIGARLGLPDLGYGVKIGGGSVSLAGIEYDLQDKLILDGGLEGLEECCLRSPEKCTGTYISEVWRGKGSLHRINSSEAAIKATIKELDKFGGIDFGGSKNWSMSSEWDKPMYFAYRTSAFQKPSCESYMNNLEEVEGKLLFTGVSERIGSEQKARQNARTDAVQQVVRYIGEEFEISGDDVQSSAAALMSGVKDSLICLDPTTETPEGPAYLARVRMYVDAAKVEAAVQEMQSKTGSK